ncbi:hypothetical protein Rs2_46972 [Raphanus sativus]|nr:hypothetical protein Rs2_46972 [Raphanus sativus]
MSGIRSYRITDFQVYRSLELLNELIGNGLEAESLLSWEESHFLLSKKLLQQKAESGSGTWKSCIRSHGEDIADARLIQIECTEATCSSCMVPEELDLPGLLLSGLKILYHFAKRILQQSSQLNNHHCISLLGGALNQLLQELMQIRSPVCAWVLISRLLP